MLFSVIVPVYNKEVGIAASLHSILSQSYGDFELIIVDDGSTDHSLDVVNSFVDDRIITVSQKNSGPSAARNKGISIAHGEWLLFLDADDELVPDALVNFKLLIEEYEGINVICCNHFIEKDGVTVLRSGISKDGVIRNNYFAWFFNLLLPSQGSTIFNKKLMQKYAYPENLRRWEDIAMLFEIMREERIVRSHIPSFIYHRGLSQGMFARKDIKEDYLGHLTFNNKSFWEKMCLYKLYKEAESLYPEQTKEIYSGLYVPYYIIASYYIVNHIFSFASFVKKVAKKAM